MKVVFAKNLACHFLLEPRLTQRRRKIWGLAPGHSPGPNMCADVGKRLRSSGCLQSHVVLEATGSLSCGEQHTCLGARGCILPAWVLLALFLLSQIG